MKGTKRCPYCGEEIMAKAKKCRHCGEWLEQPKLSTKQYTQQTDDGKISKCNIEQITPPCSPSVTVVLFILAVISECILLVHESWLSTAVEEYNAFGLGKWRTVDNIFKAMLKVPVELCSVANIVAIIGLLILFLKGMKEMSRPFTSLTGWLIGITTLSWIFVIAIYATIDDDTYNSDSAAYVVYLFAFTVFIAASVLQIVLGNKLICSYKKDLWSVGLFFILTGCSDLVYFVSYIIADSPFGLLQIIASCLDTGLYTILYYKLGNLLGMPSYIRKELVYVIGLFIAGVLTIGIDIYQKYGDLKYDDFDEVEQTNESQNDESYYNENNTETTGSKGYYRDYDDYSCINHT